MTTLRHQEHNLQDMLPLSTSFLQQSSQVIFTNKSDLASWIAAIATFFASIVAILIALFGDWAKTIFFKPILKVGIKMSPPDCHKIESTVTDQNGNVISSQDTYYYRLRIRNDGNLQAQDVEVKLLTLWKKHPNGRYYEDHNFLPLNLVWSHSLGKIITTPKIQPKIFKHCDLCHTINTPSGLLIQFDTDIIPNRVTQNRYPTIIDSGKYRLKIVIVANNSKPLYKTLQIDFTGHWYNDEEEMFRNGLSIKSL